LSSSMLRFSLIEGWDNEGETKLVNAKLRSYQEEWVEAAFDR
jgi:hypothetical protein